MTDLFIMPHLGLGDGLICNGLVRKLCNTHQTVGWCCLHHNKTSFDYLWADLKNLKIVGVDTEDQGHELTRFVEERGVDTLKLGLHAEEKPDLKKWDTEFYRQAGVDPEDRWSCWKIGKIPKQISPPSKPFVFVHDDPDRKFTIDKRKLPKKIDHLVSHSVKSSNLLEWLRCLKEAREIHCIDSCFAILADLVETTGKLVMHDYARGWHPQAKPPSRFAKKWEHV